MRMVSLFPGIPSAPTACCSPEPIFICMRLHKWPLWTQLRASGGEPKMNFLIKKGLLFMQAFLIIKNERGKKREQNTW